MQMFPPHCANGISHIQGIYFDHSYSLLAHADSLRINIAISAVHRLTAKILDVINAFQNLNVPIHERVYVSPPPYYLDWFEKPYPNVSLHLDEVPFCLQFINGIYGKKPSWNTI